MIVYLATPYSHPEEEIRLARFQKSCIVAAWVMQKGHTVFCPIAHSHPIAEFLPCELLMDHHFWMTQDLPLLEKCDELWVYPYDAEDVSRGVAREVEHAKQHKIPVVYVHPREVFGG